MNIHRFDSAAAASDALAARIADALQRQPRLALGLPAGRTMIPVYAELQRLRAGRGLASGGAVTFQVDEFIGLPPGHPGSFRQFLERHLLRDFGVATEHTHFLDGNAEPEGECARYERVIAAAGGVDLQLLGIGRNGHIGFNEPGDALLARTHRVALHPETRRANALWFDGGLAHVPYEALSMGMATLLSARSIAVIATGVEKAEAIGAAICGPITTQLPASFLQLHGAVDVYLDAAAGARLTR